MTKQCKQCGEIKEDSSFRYIKYFDALRSICKDCERHERRTAKKDRQDYSAKILADFGVTPAVLHNLSRRADLQAGAEARNFVFSSLSAADRRIYALRKGLDDLIDTIGTILVGSLFAVPFVLLRYHFVTWSFTFWSTVVATLALVWILKAPKSPIDLRIAHLTESKGQSILRDLIQERREYESFYQTPEWRLLREQFLRTRKRTYGHYVCDICHKPIIPPDVLTIDHIRPRSLFPELAMDIANLQLAHLRCNSSKGANCEPNSIIRQ